MAQRFRGFLPVVVDFETGGFDPQRHALLEIACVFVRFDGDRLVTDESYERSVKPFDGSLMDPASLKVTGIDPNDPNRAAIAEHEALNQLFHRVRKHIKAAGCQRAIMVAHNAAFDQAFLNQAIARGNLKRSPFHPFSTLDTAALAAVAYGQTVLSRACERAGIEFDTQQAHNALYDAQQTAELFCNIVNRWPYEPPPLQTLDSADEDDAED
ncbi:MAG: ribonuclease T [Pseudomonadota bacterium]